MRDPRSILGVDEPQLNPYSQALHRWLVHQDVSHPLLETALQLQLELLRHSPEAYYQLWARPEFIGAILLPVRAALLTMRDDIEISAQHVAFLLNPANPSLDEVESLACHGYLMPVGTERPNWFRLGDVRHFIEDDASPLGEPQRIPDSSDGWSEAGHGSNTGGGTEHDN